MALYKVELPVRGIAIKEVYAKTKHDAIERAFDAIDSMEDFVELLYDEDTATVTKS